jgi:alpha-beta hydrolase superfamily lysophospholipase
MPYFDGDGGRVHYRTWVTRSEPEATIVFLHGFGEHSGLYGRLANALTGRRIDLWALDHIGHGLSDGQRGNTGPIDALVTNARLLTGLAQTRASGAPLFLAGHSLGGVAAAVAAAREASPWSGVVLSGTPIEPPAWVERMLAGDDEGLAFEPTDLSSDAWYLDALANDPLAFTESEGGPLDALAAGWMELAERLSAVQVPVLFVHGSDDPVAPVQVSREGASRLPGAKLAEFAGARHDVLNEHAHDAVAGTIADWILAHLPAPASLVGIDD